ncbi:NAD(P)H-quinone oxidoreductase subunit K [Dorcoceras hygrometricum]|uniref:NAD(P)H-quinone oxidoreductase subunit K n=1 Tax=Dorcoceras hygrometricum TaxID=472368 RepID=A0A2Z7DIH3_9LAMI|nr:NAD(P)H-quinone oxidoreductase subunit K [Dorcoceras hygrometricum]
MTGGHLKIIVARRFLLQKRTRASELIHIRMKAPPAVHQSLQAQLSKMVTKNDKLQSKYEEIIAENKRLNQLVISWTKSSVSLSKLNEIQNPLNDKTDLGFNCDDNSSSETYAQSVDWAVKMRIRPPEFETSICDAKYHVSLDDEGFSFLVVDRIGDFYRNLPRRADVIVTTVGARHKCQQVPRFIGREHCDVLSMQMDGSPDELSNYPRSDSPSGCHLSSGESEHSRCRYSDLQDVCMAIESLTTLDLSRVVDSIGIYELKGPYYTLTMTDWFLQALSVIPRGSCGDVFRRFIIVRWVDQKMCFLIHNELEKEKYAQQKLFSIFSPSPPLPPHAIVFVVEPSRHRSPPSPSHFTAIVPTRRFCSRNLHWGSSALQRRNWKTGRWTGLGATKEVLFPLEK